MNEFILHHAEKIIGVLRGFDRMRFRGTLRRISSASGMETYLKYMHVFLKHFGTWSKSTTEVLRQASEESEAFQGRPNIYLDNPKVSKEDLAKSIAKRDAIEEGPICILRAVEPCWTFDFKGDKAAKQINIVSKPRKCLHIYQYQIHPQLGFMHARLQTWAPFNIKICINGREWLRRQLDLEKIRYVKKENCFIEIVDIEKAQTLMDQQLATKWVKLLEEITGALSPAHQKVFSNYPLQYYWSLDESEWATDIMFKDEWALTPLYETLIRYGITTFGSRDVLRFLGRSVPMQGGIRADFIGEATTSLKQRAEGIRIKHQVNANSVKMYNKQGSVLRVETTINRPREFKVFRKAENAPKSQKPTWRYLRKGVADLKRRARVADACNERYLAALASVEQATTLREITQPITRPVSWKKGKVRPLNVFRVEDADLLHAVSRGEFNVNGFRNRDLRAILFKPCADPQRNKRLSALVTRKLRLLRAHGIIAKVSHTHRYLLNEKGKLLCAALDAAANANTQQLLKIAA